MFPLVADCSGRGCTESVLWNTNIQFTLLSQRKDKNLNPVPLSTPRDYLQSTSGVNIFVYRWKTVNIEKGQGRNGVGWDGIEKQQGKLETG